MDTSTIDDHETVSWPLEKFAVGKDFKSTNPTKIFVDRSTHEFGIVYYDSDSAAAVEQFPDTDEPVFFQAKLALSACWHSKCKKVSLLFHHLQIDLGFCSAKDARDFLDTFEDAAATTYNIAFCTYEYQSGNKFKEDTFDMVKEQLTGRIVQPWMDAHVPSSEWPRTGEWSDFTIIAGERSFSVHRVKLCKESYYFKAVCNGGFAESNDCWVKLPESERTIDVLLDEIYETYNSTTGSLFTGFALRSEMEKECVLNDLLDVFIAADKYNLEKVKTKVAKAIIDRLPFIHDVLTVVDLATCIFDEQCPQVDRGLRKAIVAQIHDRMSAIIRDEAAWKEYSGSKMVLKAVHTHMFYDDEPVQPRAAAQSAQCPSLHATPMGGKRQHNL